MRRSTTIQILPLGYVLYEQTTLLEIKGETQLHEQFSTVPSLGI